MDNKDLLDKIKINVVQGRVYNDDEGLEEGWDGTPAVCDLVKEAVEKGINSKTIVIDGLTSAMDIVGKRFETGEFLIPDMLASAECVGAAMDILKPYMNKEGIKSKGKFIIGTVAGDLHDIGKNIVSIMLKGDGYEIIDLGHDVPSEKIAMTVKEQKPDYLGLSALLTTTMQNMKNVIDQISDMGIRNNVKILIGGAPTSKEFAHQIGADAYCSDAFQAIDILRSGL